MIKKEIRFQPELNKAIQEHADLFCEGVFVRAVRELTRAGLESSKLKNNEHNET